MRITKLKIKNFRLLKDVDLQLEDQLSLVIGKNNTGKTSLLSLFERFLNDRKNVKDFTCDDFNLDFQKYLKSKVETGQVPTECLGVSLKIFIEYDENDNLANLRQIMMDLDPANRTVVLSLGYFIAPEDFQKLIGDFKEFQLNESQKLDEKFPIPKKATKDEAKAHKSFIDKKKKFLFYDFLKKNYSHYFKLSKRAILFNTVSQQEDESTFVDLIKENIQLDPIINVKVIHAKREMSNRKNDKTLSDLSAKYYEKKESQQSDTPAVQNFKEVLTETDIALDEVYQGLFKTVIAKVEKFGGLRPGDSLIKVISSLQHRELLKDNTTVMYGHDDDHSLPEHYNGLGYMNLIGIIFEIELVLSDFRKEQKEEEPPSDINLLFIEEPEAHTHPQMQYIFIKNVKEILLNASKGDNGQHRPFKLQTVITTHSSHIVADSQFDDIKYFKRENKNEVSTKSLKDLEKEYAADGHQAYFKFLKQYLTLNRAELFFADKAIFIEGDTERILLPAMMRKVDDELPENPLLSQNISIVEVGNYSHIFERFIRFVGIKSLIVTDLDSAKEVEIVTKKSTKRMVLSGCPVADPEAKTTTNGALKHFFADEKLAFYISLLPEMKILSRSNGHWKADKAGKLHIIFQGNENNADGIEYHARSFEDAFFHLNKKFVVDSLDKFPSLKNTHLFDTNSDPFELSEKCVESKPSLAMDILLNSETDASGKPFSNWQVPEYIKTGLQWLKQD